MAWEITPEELWFRYADGERDFPGIKLLQSERATSTQLIDLRGFDLRGINLRGAYLRNADLTEADLTGADLTGAVLIEAYLERAVVRDASLFSANLKWCNLVQANLRGTNLDHVNATSAIFCRASINAFEYAILANADFRDATIDNPTLCRGFNLIWNTTMSDGSVEVGSTLR